MSKRTGRHYKWGLGGKGIPRRYRSCRSGSRSEISDAARSPSKPQGDASEVLRENRGASAEGSRAVPGEGEQK